MSDVVIVGLLSLVGTIIGTLGGIIATSRLTTYRIEQLEKKVDKHNQIIERTYRLEEDVALIQAEDKRQNTRIEKLENKE